MDADDELVARLRKAVTASAPARSKDWVMLLPLAERAKLTESEIVDLGLAADADGNRCRTKARISQRYSGGSYGIPVVVPGVVRCGRPRGHGDDHCTPPRGPLGRTRLGRLYFRLALRSSEGSCWRWAPNLPTS